jgi:hypothetical protein
MASKCPIWSGQEVLANSLNNAHSEWIIGRMGQVRVWPKGYWNYVKKVRSFLKLTCMNPIFENAMTLCVIMNTIIMSMDSYGIDKETEDTLAKMNQVFTWIFIYEMAVKLLSIGPKKYSASKWNLLDGSVVLMSIIELVIESQ